MSLIQINSSNLTDVTWQNASNCGFEIDSSIDVWKIRVSDNPALLQKFSALLTPAEIARGNRFFQVIDSNRHITTRGALRIILSRYLKQAPETIEFGVTQTDKPYISNNTTPPVYFNVSHSGDWILVGIAPDELGVDVEYIKPAFNFNEIIAQNFSPEENRFITESKPLNRFFMLWTRKEALLKATGQGLNNDLSLFSCLDGVCETESSLIETTKNWQISTFNMADDYWASICADPLTLTLHFYSFDF